MSATHRTRAKKAVAASIALAVVFAGVAFAYFASEARSANAVTGGTLTVTAEGLPLDFGTQTLYPTSATEPETAIISSFDISNDNPVSAGYSISAKDSSEPGSDAAAQFQNLYVKITSTSSTSETDQAVPGVSTPFDDTTTTPHTTTYYVGRLADLDAAHAADLGSILKDGARTYDVAVWLADTDQEQPQGVPTNFELTLRAKTPGTTASTTSTTQP